MGHRACTEPTLGAYLSQEHIDMTHMRPPSPQGPRRASPESQGQVTPDPHTRQIRVPRNSLQEFCLVTIDVLLTSVLESALVARALNMRSLAAHEDDRA